MNYEIVMVKCEGTGHIPGSHPADAWRIIDNQSNRFSPCEAYQRALNCRATKPQPDVQIYIHDDVTIHEKDWLENVLMLFRHMDATVVGFGGATSLGSPDLYKVPYRLENMARGGYVSNQTDWQVHGGREAGFRQVAVVDAFMMAVRTDFLRKIGGWPVQHLTHHCLDLWLCCEAARHDRKVFLVGCSVTHHGGGTSVKDIYRNAAWLQGGTRESDHQEPHRWLAQEYRDVLPLRVK